MELQATMAEHQPPLRGSCSCGRNSYTITIPPLSSETAQVFFDDSAAHRRSQATPLSAWIRVPLTWYKSSTTPFFVDETHTLIRRTYTGPHETHSKRNFCGFCGTPLSYWSESPASEAEYISVTLGSLSAHDLRDLEVLSLLREEVEIMEVEEKAEKHAQEGLPWFESLVAGSQLGGLRKSWGKKKSGDGRYTVEWEITEWTEDGETEEGETEVGETEEGETEEGETEEGETESASPAKRKIGEVIKEDEEMGVDN